MSGAPLDVLRPVPLFADLDEAQLTLVARAFKERRFPQGEVVVHEGSGGAAFFVIVSGTATVVVGGHPRRELGAGDFFGEIALIDEGERSATITATSDLVCYGVTHWDFRPLVESNGPVAWKLLVSMTRMLREAEKR